MAKQLCFGCIADDFTGASDAASFLVKGGLNTVLCNGVPSSDFQLPENCEAVVVALKSRTQETAGAIRDSLSAVRWLESQGAGQFYFKYCSTFDSTPKGNIGPVLDALMEYFGTRGTILCPALPANERIVKDGILYVKGIPLAESPMKDHPLTPMWESRIQKLMEPQGAYPSIEVHRDDLQGERDTLLQALEKQTAGKEHFYVIPDYVDESDAEIIAELFGNWKVLSGGSGILTALAKRIKRQETRLPPAPQTRGAAILLSGSCSTATGAQIQHYLGAGAPGLRLEDQAVLSGTQTAQQLWAQAESLGKPALIYAYETPEGLKSKRTDEGRKLSAAIEHILAETASKALAGGVKRIIVAGGETSGAVIQALGFQGFWIGESVAPGVPVLTPLEQTDVRLVLKSGNFGQEDFFSRALELTEE